MLDEQQPKPQDSRADDATGARGQGGEGGEPGMDPTGGARGGKGPGGKETGTVGIIALALYLVLFTLFVIYCLVKIWPVPTPSRNEPPSASPSPSASATVTPSPTATTSPATQTASPPAPRTSPAASQVSPSPSPSPSPSATPLQPSRVTILWWQFDLWDEQRLLLLVILGGALGTLVHSLRSVYWYVGERSLVNSWLAMYFMLPFAGSALALVFYLVVRGGFFSPQSSFQQTSPFGFAAFSALIGMFSSQAVLKLKEVAEVLLSKPQGGANAKPQESVNPAVVRAPPTPPTPPTGGKPPVQQ
jgi:hypothetical protein